MGQQGQPENERSERPTDTREFLAQWNAATEAHLTVKLTAILHKIGGTVQELDADSAEAYERLAPYVLRALQVAAHPGATVHDAVDFLEAHCH